MDFDHCHIFHQPSDSEVEDEGEWGSVVPLVHRAASMGNTQQLLQEVQQDPSMLEQQNAEGLTPLGQAVLSQQMSAVKRLIKMGANINAQDAIGRTCLSIATYQGWLDGVVYLLRNGARQNIGDKAGRYPIHAATYDTDHRTLLALLQTSPPVDINQQDHEQMTALHWAAFHRRPDHIQCLLERGAVLLLQDMDGKLPLHWAAQNGSVECCKLLLQCGQSDKEKMLTAQDHSGKTAMHFAAAAGHAEILMLLATHPACLPDCEDPDDRTPLHWASAMGHAQCVRALIDLGVKVNVVDADGGTPLSYASQSGHSECVRILEQALNIPHDKSELKKCNAPSSRRGKNPLGFLKGLFQSNRKRSSMSALKSSVPDTAPADKRFPEATASQNPKQSALSHTPGAKSDGASEKVSLPSISTIRDSRRDTGSHEAAGSVESPLSTRGRMSSGISGQSTQKVAGFGEQTSTDVKGGKIHVVSATHIPVLPPLLPALPDREKTVCTSMVDDLELGPLRGVKLPQAKQLNARAADRVHDGMLFQKSATDFWSLPSAQTQSGSSRGPETNYPGLKGRKRSRRKSRRQNTFLTSPGAADVSEACHGHTVMADSMAMQPLSSEAIIPHPRPRLHTTLSASSLISTREDAETVCVVEDQMTSATSPKTRESKLFVEAASVSLHSKGSDFPQHERKRLITRKSDLRLMDI